MDAQKIANQVLKEYPGQNEVHITSDGQAFFNEIDARNHSTRNGLENTEVFFREGFEPEDTKGLEETLQAAQDEAHQYKTVVDEIEKALNATEIPKVDQSTNTTVAAVIGVLEEKAKTLSTLVDLETDVLQAANLELNSPEITESTSETVKAVIDLRNLYQESQKELDTLKASSIEVKENQKTGK